MIRGHCKLAIPVSLLLLWILCPLSARAAAPQTFLVLETDPVIAVGVHPTVTVRLTTAAGWVGGVPLEIRLDGHQMKRLLTNRDGRASTVLAKDLDAGDYKVQAVFKGTSDYLASQSAVAIIHVTPASLTIQTVPPLPNVPLLKLDGGRPLSTGADGTIRILIARVRRYELEVTLPPTDSDRQLTFDRWGDGSRESKRTIRLPGTANLAVGLEVSYRVAFSFVDSTGTAVDPARIQSLRVANSRGDVLQPRSFASEWLIGNQIVRREGGLTSVPLEYRIQEVEVRGSNVVDRGRLHFRPDGETRDVGDPTSALLAHGLWTGRVVWVCARVLGTTRVPRRRCRERNARRTCLRDHHRAAARQLSGTDREPAGHPSLDSARPFARPSRSSPGDQLPRRRVRPRRRPVNRGHPGAVRGTSRRSDRSESATANRRGRAHGVAWTGARCCFDSHAARVYTGHTPPIRRTCFSRSASPGSPGNAQAPRPAVFEGGSISAPMESRTFDDDP